jgi:hypothetical protein
MKVKKFFSIITMLTVLLSFSTTAFADNVSQIIGDGNTVVFVDVPSNYWAKDQIDYFAQQGIVAGYEDGSFQPEAGVTREEFCKLLVATFKQPLETPNTPTFADVAEDRWSYPYVEVCREFLTGYANPFGGLPTFHPTEYATREDIAVALVRMMGFTDSDANDKNYAGRKFYDGSSISPSLMPYVSIACERGLISGYPDGNFGPTQGITRAETVVLLNRATKQAVTNINADLQISANVLYSEDGKTATINVLAEEGTTVTVNGETIKMSSNYYGEYEGNYVYKFETEGTKDFVVEGKRAGKTKTVNLMAKYEVGAPVLTITTCPATSDKKNVTIKGTVSDVNDNKGDINVTINGNSVYNSYGSWSKDVTLKEGENTFTIVATNSLGKSTTETRTISFVVGAPTLTITTCPETSDNEKITIKGTVSDVNDNKGDINVTVNGNVAYNSYGSWSKEVTLEEGINTITIVATNSLGKSTTEERKIKFSISAPEIQFINCPETTTKKELTVKGKIKGGNKKAMLFINDEECYVNSSGEFSETLTLKEGTNTFKFRAVNDYGKEVTETKTIIYSATAEE